jgi:hypothetical protein
MLRLTLFRIRTFRSSVNGNFLTRLGIGGIPFLFPLLYQVGLGLDSDSIRSADDAAGHRGDEPEDDDALDSGEGWIPGRVDFEHPVHWPAHLRLLNHWKEHAHLADRCRGILLRLLHVAAIHEHEHACLRRRDGRRGEQRKLHREHGAAVVHHLRYRDGLAADGLLSPARFQSNPLEFIGGVHKAFYVLGGMTLLSTIVFFELRKGDGDAVSEGV